MPLSQWDRHRYVCAVCEGSTFERVYSFGLFSKKQYVVVCTQCGVVCLNPRMDEDGYATYYRELYYGEWQPAPQCELPRQTRLRNARADARSRKIYGDLSKYIAKHVHILEVGCGDGNNLLYLQAEGYKNLTGVEPGGEFCDALRDLGVQCFATTLERFCIEQCEAGMRYDCVVLSHVLEHFVEPQKALAMLYALTKPGALVYVLVPAFFGSEDCYAGFQAPHTYYFSHTTLKRLLHKHGFELREFFDSEADEIALLAARAQHIPLGTTARHDLQEYRKVMAHLCTSGGRRKARLKEIARSLVETVMNEEMYTFLRFRLLGGWMR